MIRKLLLALLVTLVLGVVVAGFVAGIGWVCLHVALPVLQLMSLMCSA